MKLYICSRAVRMAALLLMLMSHVTSGCQCPSCHYADAAQNCQCCVYRQLGKRSDPALNFDLSVPQVLSLPHYATANSAPSSNQYSTSRMPNSLASRDWSAAKLLRQPAASYHDVSYDVRNGDFTKSGLTGKVGFLPSLSQRMEALSRVVDNIKLASALEAAEVSQQQDRSYEYSN